MCYPKPGPRCSTHSLNSLRSAKTRLASIDPADTARIKKWTQKVEQAKEDYYTSPAGIKLFREKAKTTGEQKYAIRAEQYAAKRKAQMDAYKALSADMETLSNANKKTIVKPASKSKISVVVNDQGDKTGKENTSKSKPKLYTVYAENVELKTINPTALTKEQSKAGFSSLVCKCGRYFSLREARNIHEREIGGSATVYCPSCNRGINRLRDVDHVVNYDSAHLLNSENAKNAVWYHATDNPRWIEDMTSMDEAHYVHVGTKKASMDLIGAKFYEHNPKSKQEAVVYEISLKPDTQLSQKIYSDDNQWHAKIDEKSSLNIGGDAVRYLNIWEDPGSISMMVDPRKLIVRKVSRVTSKDYDGQSLDRRVDEFEKPSLINKVKGWFSD